MCLLSFSISSCNKDDVVPDPDNNDIEIEEIMPAEPTMRTIHIGASSGESDTKATLSGNRVIWNEGDEFKLIKEGPIGTSDIMRFDLNKTNTGIGFKISGALISSEVNIKYESISVIIDGEDVTDSIVSESTDDNKYKVGATNNTNNHYQYAPAGKEMKVKLYGNGNEKAFVIARVSSSATIQNATVIIKGLQYKFNIGSWNTINSSKGFVTGNSIDKNLNSVESFGWVFGITSDFRLDDGNAGNPFGNFSGQIPDNDDIDSKTFALFPKSALSKYELGSLSINIPSTQDYQENTFNTNANIMLGKVQKHDGEVYDASFKNMMGIFVLSLKGSYEISSISVTDKSGAPLWGTASISAADYLNGISTNQIAGGSSTITMNCPGVILSDTETSFYFVVPGGAFKNGLEIKVKTPDNKTMSLGTSKDNTISVNNIKRMPTTRALEDFNVENSVLTGYLDRGPYEKWGASTYFTGTLASQCVDKDYPNTYNVAWDGDANSSYTVTLTDESKVSTKATGSDVYTDRVITGTSYGFTNLVPGHTYSYSIKNAGSTIKSGSFRASGRVRMIKINDTWNVRDMGGWTGLKGKTIAYEWIYRGGSLNGECLSGTSKISRSKNGDPNNYKMFSDESRQQIIDLGIKSELDLRRLYSEESGTDNDYPHKYSIGVPHTDVDGWNFYRIALNDAQADDGPLKSPVVVQAAAWVIDQVLHDKPVYFHCKSGADRTGILGMIINALLGVSEGNIALEFEITNFSHEQKVVQGQSKIREKYTYKVSETFYTKGFTTLGKGSWQENAYYYLNQYFKDSGNAISSTDLDRFIAKMLGMSSYQQPGGVVTNYTLKDIHKDIPVQ